MGGASVRRRWLTWIGRVIVAALAVLVVTVAIAILTLQNDKYSDDPMALFHALAAVSLTLALLAIALLRRPIRAMLAILPGAALLVADAWLVLLSAG